MNLGELGLGVGVREVREFETLNMREVVPRLVEIKS